MTEARLTAGNRPAAESEAGGLQPGRHDLADATPARIRQLRQTLIGIHWSYHERMREILEWVCSTDRQLDHASRETVKLWDAQERAFRSALARILDDQPSAQEGNHAAPR